MKRIVSTIVLIAFLATSTGFAAEDLGNLHLAPALRFGSLGDEHHKNIVLAKMALSGYLRLLDEVRDIDGAVTAEKVLEAFGKREEFTGSNFTKFPTVSGLPSDGVKAFFESVEHVTGNIFSIPVAVTRNGKRYNYRLLFSTIRGQSDMFPVEFCTPKEVRARAREMGVNNAIPKRLDSDAKAMERYEEHESVLDAYLAKKMEDPDDHLICSPSMKANLFSPWSSVAFFNLNGRLDLLGLPGEMAHAIYKRMEEKRLIFVRAGPGGYPHIKMEDKEGGLCDVRVGSHSSNAATWIILNDVEWEQLKAVEKEIEKERTPGYNFWRSKQSAKEFIEKCNKALFYESGVVCGLAGTAELSHYAGLDTRVYETVNDFTRLYKAIVGPPSVDAWKKIDDLREKLKAVAPVDLDTNLATRDYAAGTAPTPFIGSIMSIERTSTGFTAVTNEKKMLWLFGPSGNIVWSAIPVPHGYKISSQCLAVPDAGYRVVARDFRTGQTIGAVNIQPGADYSIAGTNIIVRNPPSQTVIKSFRTGRALEGCVKIDTSRGVKFSRDYIATCDRAGYLTVRSANTGAVINGLERLNAVNGFEITDTHLAVRDTNNYVTLIDLTKRSVVPGCERIDVSGGFTLTGEYLATVGREKTLTIRRVKSGLALPAFSGVRAPASFKLSSTKIAMRDLQLNVAVIDLPTGQVVPGFERIPHAVDYTITDTHLGVRNTAGFATLWEFASGHPVEDCVLLKSPADFAVTDRYLLTKEEASPPLIRDLRTGEEIDAGNVQSFLKEMATKRSVPARDPDPSAGIRAIWGFMEDVDYAPFNDRAQAIFEQILDYARQGNVDLRRLDNGALYALLSSYVFGRTDPSECIRFFETIRDSRGDDPRIFGRVVKEPSMLKLYLIARLMDKDSIDRMAGLSEWFPNYYLDDLLGDHEAGPQLDFDDHGTMSGIFMEDVVLPVKEAMRWRKRNRDWATAMRLADNLINMFRHSRDLMPGMEEYFTAIIDELSKELFGIMRERDESLREKPVEQNVEIGGNRDVMMRGLKVVRMASPNIRTGRDKYTWGTPAAHSRILRMLELDPVKIGVDASEPIAELWLASDDKSYPSMVALPDGTTVALPELLEKEGRRILGDRHFAKYGPFMASMMKVIDAGQPLSVQVHPASGNPERPAKPEEWMVGPGGGVFYLGFNRDVSREELEAAYREGRFEQLLNGFTAGPGDLIAVDGGLVHAIRAGSLIFEWSHAPTAEEVAKGDMERATVSPWDRTDGKTPRPGKEDIAGTIRVLDYAQERAGKNAYRKADPSQFIRQRKTLYTDNSGNTIRRLFKNDEIVEEMVVSTVLRDDTNGHGYPVFVMEGSIEIRRHDGTVTSLKKGEWALLSADLGKYELVNRSSSPCRMVRWWAALPETEAQESHGDAALRGEIERGIEAAIEPVKRKLRSYFDADVQAAADKIIALDERRRAAGITIGLKPMSFVVYSRLLTKGDYRYVLDYFNDIQSPASHAIYDEVIGDASMMWAYLVACCMDHPRVEAASRAGKIMVFDAMERLTGDRHAMTRLFGPAGITEAVMEVVRALVYMANCYADKGDFEKAAELIDNMIIDSGTLSAITSREGDDKISGMMDSDIAHYIEIRSAFTRRLGRLRGYRGDKGEAIVGDAKEPYVAVSARFNGLDEEKEKRGELHEYTVRRLAPHQGEDERVLILRDGSSGYLTRSGSRWRFTDLRRDDEGTGGRSADGPDPAPEAPDGRESRRDSQTNPSAEPRDGRAFQRKAQAKPGEQNAAVDIDISEKKSPDHEASADIGPIELTESDKRDMAMLLEPVATPVDEILNAEWAGHVTGAFTAAFNRLPERERLILWLRANGISHNGISVLLATNYTREYIRQIQEKAEIKVWSYVGRALEAAGYPADMISMIKGFVLDPKVRQEATAVLIRETGVYRDNSVAVSLLNPYDPTVPGPADPLTDDELNADPPQTERGIKEIDPNLVRAGNIDVPVATPVDELISAERVEALQRAFDKAVNSTSAKELRVLRLCAKGYMLNEICRLPEFGGVTTATIARWRNDAERSLWQKVEYEIAAMKDSGVDASLISALSNDTMARHAATSFFLSDEDDGGIVELNMALELLPAEWREDGIDFRDMARSLAVLLDKPLSLNKKTAMIFSEKVTFASGLGILLPKLAKSGRKIAVIVTGDRQRGLIDRLNRGLSLKDRIVIAESVVDARSRVQAARYYYFKVQGDPEVGDLAGVTTCDITELVERIIKILGRVTGIAEGTQAASDLYRATQKFIAAAA